MKCRRRVPEHCNCAKNLVCSGQQLDKLQSFSSTDAAEKAPSRALPLSRAARVAMAKDGSANPTGCRLFLMQFKLLLQKNWNVKRRNRQASAS